MRDSQKFLGQTRAQQHAAGTTNTALFDIVKRIRTTAHARAADLSCPGRARRDPGPRATRVDRALRLLRWVPGLVREAGAIVRLRVIDRRSLRDDAERIEARDRPV